MEATPYDKRELTQFNIQNYCNRPSTTSILMLFCPSIEFLRLVSVYIPNRILPYSIFGSIKYTFFYKIPFCCARHF